MYFIHAPLVFITLGDEYSESSDVVRWLTETNLAIPRGHFFNGDTRESLDPECPPLTQAIKEFVTEERA